MPSYPATGSRLRRGRCQAPAGYPVRRSISISTSRSRNTGSSASADDDGWSVLRFVFQWPHLSDLAARCARVLHEHSPSENRGLSATPRGSRECRAFDAPAAPRVESETRELVTAGGAGNTRHSPRNGFNGFLRALPGDRAFLPPSPVKISSHQLDASVGATGPHGFAVRKISALVSSATRVHRIPTLRS